MRTLSAILFAFLTGCHSGEPRGTVPPADPVIGTWRGAEQPAALVLFSTLGEYRAVGIEIAGVPRGRWRRYSQSDIVLEREDGSTVAVTADFDGKGDRVTLSWPAIVPIDEPIPVASEVRLVRISMMGVVDGGSAAGSMPDAGAMP